MKNKKGASQEMIFMIYRLILISFIALIILGLSAVFYGYYINIRDSEARILAKQVVNCIIPDGYLEIENFNGQENKILEHCGFSFSDEVKKRFYVLVRIYEPDDKELKKLEQGDSGAVWIKEIFDKQKSSTESIKKYEPGYFNDIYEIKDEKGNLKNKIKIEVFAGHEF